MLLNLIQLQRPNTDRIYLYVKDPFESKYQLLINEREIKKTKNPKAFIDYSQTSNSRCLRKFGRLQSNKKKSVNSLR